MRRGPQWCEPLWPADATSLFLDGKSTSCNRTRSQEAPQKMSIADELVDRSIKLFQISESEFINSAAPQRVHFA